jgi:transmembrane sensor
MEPHQLRNWLRWTQGDPRNLDAFERMQNLMHGLEAVDRGQKAAIARELLADEERAPLRSARPRWHWQLASGLAAVVVAALVLVGLNHYPDVDAGPFVAQYTTPHGKNRTFSLPDGTSVTLGADSILRVDYRADARSLDLVSGEAFFTVHHDAERPFVVQVGVARIEDLGTQFDVRRDSDQVVVAVASGIVSVAYSEAGASTGDAKHQIAPIDVTAGREVVMATATPKRPIQHRAVDGTVGAWRTGRLQFRDTPLSTVVANINRYSATPIVLDGPSVEQLRFTGTIYVDRIDTWLTAVQKALPVSEQKRSDTNVVLALRKP